VYENRLASFQGAQPIAKRRPSNASSRAPKALHWPHKSLSSVEVGFFPLDCAGLEAESNVH